MASQINTTPIDATKPQEGNATTLSVRDNFSAVKAALETTKSEMTAVQDAAAAAANPATITHTLLYSGSAYPARPSYGYSVFVGPVNPEAQMQNGDRWENTNP